MQTKAADVQAGQVPKGEVFLAKARREAQPSGQTRAQHRDNGRSRAPPPCATSPVQFPEPERVHQRSKMVSKPIVQHRADVWCGLALPLHAMRKSDRRAQPIGDQNTPRRDAEWWSRTYRDSQAASAIIAAAVQRGMGQAAPTRMTWIEPYTHSCRARPVRSSHRSRRHQTTPTVLDYAALFASIPANRERDASSRSTKQRPLARARAKPLHLQRWLLQRSRRRAAAARPRRCPTPPPPGASAPRATPADATCVRTCRCRLLAGAGAAHGPKLGPGPLACGGPRKSTLSVAAKTS
jgi:hypothetical protein